MNNYKLLHHCAACKGQIHIDNHPKLARFL